MSDQKKNYAVKVQVKVPGFRARTYSGLIVKVSNPSEAKEKALALVKESIHVDGMTPSIRVTSCILYNDFALSGQ